MNESEMRGLSPLDRSPVDGRRRAGGLMIGAIGELERALLTDALVWCRGVKIRTAETLGISRVPLDRLISKWGIDLKSIKARARAGGYRYQTAPEGAPWVKGGGENDGEG